MKSFPVRTEYFVYSVFLFFVSCHAWGYHHPAAIRLPTDKPTTTTTTTKPPTTTISSPPVTTTLPTTLGSSETSSSTSSSHTTTFSDIITQNYTLPTVVGEEQESFHAFSTANKPTPTTSPPKSSEITEPTTATTTSSTSSPRVPIINVESVQTTATPTTTKPTNPEGNSSSTTPQAEAPTDGNEQKVSSSSAAAAAALVITSSPTFVHEDAIKDDSVSTPLQASTEVPAVINAPTDNATKSATMACLRNESQVSYWDFGYCATNCTSDKDCNSDQNEQCLCDGPCGMTCLSPDLVSVYCDAPGTVENGKALLVGELGLYDYRNQLQRFMHNQKVIFECDEGFSLIDGPQEKICRNGLWFPAVGEPKCVFSDTPGFRWMQSNRVKRRAIKSGGTGSLARSKVAGGGGRGGGGESRRGRKRGGQLGIEEEEVDASVFEAPICPTLDYDDFLIQEIVSRGSDPNNTEVSDGAVVRVSCQQGYGVNLQNDTIVCEKGKWRPKLPQCNALPCKVPYIPHSTFYTGGKALFFLEMKYHGTSIEIRCSKGYVLKGPSKFHCWYGEWDLTDAPECIPASCELPQLDRGKYVSRYRAGMVVGHGTEVDYHCDGDYQKMQPGGPAKCHLGEWRPNRPACFNPSYIHGLKNFTHDKDNKLITSIKRSCGVPPKEKGAIFYVEGKPIDYDTDYIFPDSTEVMYRCAAAKPKPRNRWKMVCEDGQWNGASHNLTCEINATISANITSVIKETIRMINSSCTYRKKETHVVTFFNNQQLQMETSEFAPGSIIINRCIDIGKFKLVGAVRRKCIAGQWLGITPKCEGLSQYYDYVVDKPPTILFRYLNGSIVQTNDGELMVYPGTTLHMECLYIRKFGRPQWNVSNTHKTYPEGWTDGIENRDPMLEYRLTIEEASDADSGSYSCITPSRHGHEIKIQVKKVDCAPLPENNDLEYSTDATMLGTKVTFTCKDSNFLMGVQEIVCQATGSWSAPVPKCENVECPDISMLPAMAPLAHTSITRNGTLKRNETAPPKITIMGRDVGGKAIFSCSQGYMVEGASEAVCQPNGEWSSAIPLCKEVECPSPPSPQNGYVTGNPPYKAGDLAQFECRQGYMMEGQPIIACQDSGKWSRSSSTTKCVKACTYPGTTIGGTISAVKFYYPIGETVEFDCTEGYDLQGSRMLHCLESAKWSTSIPNCIPREGNAPSIGKK